MTQIFRVVLVPSGFEVKTFRTDPFLGNFRMISYDKKFEIMNCIESKIAITVIMSLQFIMMLMIDVVYSTEYKRIFVCNIATLAQAPYSVIEIQTST